MFGKASDASLLLKDFFGPQWQMAIQKRRLREPSFLWQGCKSLTFALMLDTARPIPPATLEIRAHCFKVLKMPTMLSAWRALLYHCKAITITLS